MIAAIWVINSLALNIFKNYKFYKNRAGVPVFFKIVKWQ